MNQLQEIFTLIKIILRLTQLKDKKKEMQKAAHE